MLRRAEAAARSGARRPRWARGEGLPGAACSQPPKGEARRGGSRSRWPLGRRGGQPGVWRKLLGSRTHSHLQHSLHIQRGRAARRCQRPCRPRVLLSLRRTAGMRAPRNTNQFLMREKYRLLHLRSDSVGTESGASDCEAEPRDADSEPEALPEPPEEPPPPRAAEPCAAPAQEESQQYFPSEDDVLESQLFMERDFLEFCSSIA